MHLYSPGTLAKITHFAGPNRDIFDALFTDERSGWPGVHGSSTPDESIPSRPTPVGFFEGRFAAYSRSS